MRLLSLLCSVLAAASLALYANEGVEGSPLAGPAIKKFFEVTSPAAYVREKPDGSVLFVKDRTSGGAVLSTRRYRYGIFSVKLRFEKGFTAGIVCTFYFTSTGIDSTKKQADTRDEIDMEFLGNTNARGIIFATNFYSAGRGQGIHEEGFRLWFDPSDGYHTYTIKWGTMATVFYIDGIPLREIVYQQAKNYVDYPTKPQYLAGSIWEASDWATDGGRIRANYSYAPFAFNAGSVDLRQLCSYVKGAQPCWSAAERRLTTSQRNLMQRYRDKFLAYSNVGK